eukprot:CAMPEP_0202965720 /NCGR_PEP_ID=MMETSP1396-20130829/9713_1 /ASSEMBLY_ACC=CAM_ASM_000872 /TAXON_ID= /ORGANISM="Pseudokeronopsis sp., Strain Brazil" /LENGTH=94 /DNA_ID=CAMNT_0049688649 /DNA_START=528 /DNA_END=815 /DNA_ORIENTATION=+
MEEADVVKLMPVHKMYFNSIQSDIKDPNGSFRNHSKLLSKLSNPLSRESGGSKVRIEDIDKEAKQASPDEIQNFAILEKDADDSFSQENLLIQN